MTSGAHSAGSLHPTVIYYAPASRLLLPAVLSSNRHMQKLSGNGIHLFRLFGIDVFLHWSWILVAVIEFEWRQNSYNNQLWNIAEYLTLFAIVLMHEFGHSLACRSVGGVANRIMLWP